MLSVFRKHVLLCDDCEDMLTAYRKHATHPRYHDAMAGLWETKAEENRLSAQPLAARMRPRSLDEFVGQSHFLGPGMLLRRMLEADRISSVIFYGPPGTGKTTLAELIARKTNRAFERANATAVGVKEVRFVLDEARRRLEQDRVRTIFFLDEIHRFSRSQQDVLLGDVERGIVTLVGATTENPFFAIKSFSDFRISCAHGRGDHAASSSCDRG